jgi:hypothetical protein
MMIATMEEGHRQACEVLNVASTLTPLVIITTMHNITNLVIITITTTITKV